MLLKKNADSRNIRKVLDLVNLETLFDRKDLNEHWDSTLWDYI